MSANLAVALARAGRRVGLLDADIHGPSQPRIMGVGARVSSPDGETIEPIQAHGVTLMSIGLMKEAGKAVVWRGPMLAALTIDLETRIGGDEGRPVAAGEGPVSEAYARLADRLVRGGMA